MNAVRRVIDIIIERVIPIVGSLFASRLETLIAIEQTEHQNEIEERARQLESEGKQHLAAALRQRAARIDPNDPGSHGQCVVQRLQQCPSAQPARLIENRDDDSQPEEDPPTVERQPKSRRTAPRRSRNSDTPE